MAGAAYLFIALCFGVAGGIVGRLKGSSFMLWFLISAIVPVFGLAAAVLSRWESDEPRRICPGCGRERPIYQAVCTRCSTELEFPEPAPAATSTPPAAPPSAPVA